MKQRKLERLRKRYEKRLNDTLRMAPGEDNVLDACDSVIQYALWGKFLKNPPVSVVDVRSLTKVDLQIFGLLYSGLPDELILKSDFNYHQAKYSLKNSSSKRPCGVRGIIETKSPTENPDDKNYKWEGSKGLIDLADSGCLSREDLIWIGKDFSRKDPKGHRILCPSGVSIDITPKPSDKFNSMEISCRSGEKQSVDLYQLDGYLLDSYLFPGLDYVIWTNGLYWKIFYKGKSWGEPIKLDLKKDYVKTVSGGPFQGMPLNMPIQINRGEFKKLIDVLKLMYHKL